MHNTFFRPYTIVMATRINIIGTGRLGKVLGRAIAQTNDYCVSGIFNRDETRLKEASAFIGQGKLALSIDMLPKADITFITTNDTAIESQAIQLSHSNSLKKESIVVHCSGVLNANILDAVKAKGCLTASLHPMSSFATPSLAHFDKVFCGVEGDDIACLTLASLFESLGAVVFPIQHDKKALYHAACTMASNYLITLSSIASQLLEESGLKEIEAVAVTHSLMQSSLDNLRHSLSPKKSLTGAIERGDTDTIKKHLNALAPNTNSLYRRLAKMTLPLTSLEVPQIKAITKLLED